MRLSSPPTTKGTIMNAHILDPEAQAIADATSTPPFLYQLGAEGARKVLDDLQAAPIAKPDVDEEWITVPAAVGDVQVRIVKPVGSTGLLPTILYIHGGGWVIGNAATHDRLVRELAVGARAALAFVEYPTRPKRTTRSRSNRLRHRPMDNPQRSVQGPGRQPDGRRR